MVFDAKATVAELREIAKEYKISGYSKMRKQELIDALLEKASTTEKDSDDILTIDETPNPQGKVEKQSKTDEEFVESISEEERLAKMNRHDRRAYIKRKRLYEMRNKKYHFKNK